nr:hypothetical protein [Acidimicrobiia bacterium]
EEHGAVETAAAWPRPYDPAKGIDISGVKGVTAKQERRAKDLIEITQKDLPMYADPADAEVAGYRSIGDAATGVEHYVNYGFLGDDTFLDPKKAESLVYQVDGDKRTLVSAMYIAEPEFTSADDPDLAKVGGKLMTWHVHQNLCWAGGEDGPKVVGTADRQEDCPPGSVLTGGDRPMVHVWIAPHECGPFAALEGHGAGQAGDVERTDQCDQSHSADGGHGDDHGESAAIAPKPYDPTKPIDLSGVKGVTPEQQARAENLIAITLLRLPKFADTQAAYNNGYRSIGDAATGDEHYVNWSYINDKHELNPDYPESLVYQADPATGKPKLVAAMFMLSSGKTLDDVPDIGGALTQWHIHNNLCFSSDPAKAPEGAPVESVVVALTDADGKCATGYKLSENPMIHVWIVPHKCGPFSALDGIGAGQVKAGEEKACNHVHGSD